MLQLSHGDRDIAWRPLGWAVAARTLITPVGVAVVAWFSARAIAALVGVLILVTVALSVWVLDLRATARNAAVAGAVSGISGTAAAIGGPFLALVLQHERPQRVRSTLAVFFIAGSMLGLTGLFLGGELPREQVVAGLVWMPFALLGYVVSGPIRARVDAERVPALRARLLRAGQHHGDRPGRAGLALRACRRRSTDPADPRLTDYVGLTDVALRRRTEPERGLYIAESQKVIRRALAAGHRPRSYLMAARWLTDLADLVERAEADGIPVYVGEHDVIESLTGFHLHRGALAAMQRPLLPSLAAVLQHARRVLVLEDIVDHTNVGAVFRSAAALGVDAVLVTPRCADPLYRRSIRVSMGTVFQVPWTRIDPWPGEWSSCTSSASSWRRWPWPTARSASTRWPPTRRNGWRWCSAPRGTGCRGAPWRRSTSRCGSRWPGSGLAQRRGRRRRGRLGPTGAGLTVRIVVSGTHASGKSTLVSDLAMALGYAQLPDPFELVDDDVEPAGAESFGQQLAVAAERLVELPAGADVVAERGPVDFLAYLEALADLGRPTARPAVVARLRLTTAEAMAHVDLLVVAADRGGRRHPGARRRGPPAAGGDGRAPARPLRRRRARRCGGSGRGGRGHPTAAARPGAHCHRRVVRPDA